MYAHNAFSVAATNIPLSILVPPEFVIFGEKNSASTIFAPTENVVAFSDVGTGDSESSTRFIFYP